MRDKDTFFMRDVLKNRLKSMRNAIKTYDITLFLKIAT